MTPTIKFSALSPDAKLPSRGSKWAAGLDLQSIESVTLEPGERSAIRTGLAVAIPHGFYGRVAPRSGLAVRSGVDVLAGVIDSDYRGEIRCALINLGNEPFRIEPGMRIAQLIIEAVILPEPEWSNELTGTDRGSGGFGSTGS
jgi:dUTP pyrophosphatase